jgi:hypothetical protein
MRSIHRGGPHDRASADNRLSPRLAVSRRQFGHAEGTAKQSIETRCRGDQLVAMVTMSPTTGTVSPAITEEKR